MEVLDIVQSAAIKSGVISSFNPDEFPKDVLDVGVAALSQEILPTLNCDRMIDVTVTSRTYTPVNGKIVLKPLAQPNNNFILMGYSQYTAAELQHTPNGKWREEVDKFHDGWSTSWPEDDFGDPITLAIWTIDMHLVSGTDPYAVTLRDENIDFPPMRVDSILEETSRIPYEYVYRDEFERAVKFTSVPGIYTTEEYDDKIIILINGSPMAKRVVLPVPLQIINHSEQYAGSIIAPMKFKRYLIDCTAVSLAIVYGVSTVPIMQQQAEVSYNLLKKNKPQPMHQANVSEEIAKKVRTNALGRRFYANI